MQAVHLDPEAQSRLERQKAFLRLVTFAKEMRGPDRLPAIHMNGYCMPKRGIE